MTHIIATFSFLICLLQITSAVAQPKRIVTLGAGVTETVFALGLGDLVAGVDASSKFPEKATQKAQVGYIRMTSAEGIASLMPDLVLAGSTLGPASVKKQLQAASIRLELVEKPTDVQSALQRILKIGKILNKPEEAKKLVDKIELDVAKANKLQRPNQKPRVLFIFTHGGAAVNVSGTKTAAHTMIEASGGINAVTGYEGYKPITAESLLGAQPTLILVTTRSLNAIGGEKGLWATPGLSLTPAGKTKNLVVVDDLKLLGFGPRTGETILELSKAFSK